MALLHRFCRVLARSSKSAGSCLFRVWNIPPSGEGAKNLRPVLESVGPADAAGAFRILVTRPDILLFFQMHPPRSWRFSSKPLIEHLSVILSPFVSPREGYCHHERSSYQPLPPIPSHG
jgi:hypothetical protein